MMNFRKFPSHLGIFTLFIALAFVSTGCDKDEEDTDCIYLDKRLCDPDYERPDTTEVIPFDEDLTNYQEKVLLEEFTGFLCINCPTATSTAESLKDQYPDRLSIVAIHCTPTFAGPLTDDPNEPFFLDFRTEAGEEYVNYYQPQGLPDGMINRLGTGGSATISYPNWSDRLAELMAENDPEVYLRFGTPELNDDTTAIKVRVVVKPLNIDEDESYAINVGLMESGIEEAQKAPGGETIYDYVHNHVFRGNSDGTWGRPAYDADTDLTPDQALLMSFTIEIKPEWNLSNTDLFVYVYKQSNREVVQVEERPFQ